MSATVAGLKPVTFTATATAGAPASVTLFSGEGQTQITGGAVTNNPTVEVDDAFGNPVAGVTVNFSASGSGAPGSPSDVTNASGVAATTWTVDVGGHVLATDGTFENTLSVSVAALNTAFTAYAIYSYESDVYPLWTAEGCTGCHQGASPTGGMNLDGSSADTYAALLSMDDACAIATGLRRVSSAGGVAAEAESAVYQMATGNTGASAMVDCSSTTSMLFDGPDGSANTAILQAWIRNGAPNN